jgi:tRNA U38,U39,U40 pseudouridine synthase TruA
MGPRNDKNKDLTESQKELVAIVEDAIEAKNERTQPFGRNVNTRDSSEMYEIAEKVVDRKRAEHILDCENNGPARRMCRRMDAMESRTEQRMDRIENEQMDDRKDVTRIQQALDKFIGERDFKRWLFPLATSILGSSVAAAVVSWMLRMR